MVRPRIVLLMAVCQVPLVGNPQPIDRPAGNYLQYYGFLFQEDKRQLYEYDLGATGGDWRLPEAGVSPYSAGRLVVFSSNWCSSGGLALSRDGILPEDCICRVNLWWPNRPEHMLSPEDFVRDVIWPTLQESQASFFARGETPEDRELYDDIVTPLCGKRSPKIQSCAFNRALLGRIRERYPDGKGPLGIYVEAVALNLHICM